MIFFDQTEYEKIPIWESKRRIKALTVFRDLYLDRVEFPPGTRVPLSPTTGQPFREGSNAAKLINESQRFKKWWLWQRSEHTALL
jgi:hypothetical protein